MIEYRQIVLASRPKGEPGADNFRIESGHVPTPGEGEVLVETRWLSLDPYMRGRMDDAESYAAPVPVGDVMGGEVVAEVIESRDPSLKVGDLVLAHSGWRTHAVFPAKAVRRIDSNTPPPSTRLGVLGMPGFTAYSGMKAIGQPKAGETVVVAAASGPVGSLVGQLAKLAGARAVGIAGGAKKCAYVRDELGFDAVIDHHADGLPKALAAACPDGIDVYFENVGGAIWQAVLPLMNLYGRVPVCGLISQYNGVSRGEVDRLPALMRTILTKSLTIRGFINTEFVDALAGEFQREIAPHVASGGVRYLEDITDGLENAPSAFMGMLKGKNFGKVLVRVS